MLCVAKRLTSLLFCQIYSKVWDDGVKATLAKRASEAKKMWEAEHDGRLEMQRENGQLARNTAEVEA